MHTMHAIIILAYTKSMFHLVFNTSHTTVSPPVHTLWDITRVVRGLIDLGVVAMIDPAVGHVHLLILSISLVKLYTAQYKLEIYTLTSRVEYR